MSDESLTDNILSAYNSLIHSLPQEEGSIKNVLLKTTMSPAIKIGEDKKEIEKRLVKEKPKKEETKKEMKDE